MYSILLLVYYITEFINNKNILTSHTLDKCYISFSLQTLLHYYNICSVVSETRFASLIIFIRMNLKIIVFS